MFYGRVKVGYEHSQEADLGVGLYFKPAIAQMTFASKGEYGSAVVVSDLLLFRVVADSHANVIVACAAGVRMMEPPQGGVSPLTTRC